MAHKCETVHILDWQVRTGVFIPYSLLFKLSRTSGNIAC